MEASPRERLRSFGRERFGGARLGDKRLERRLVYSADRIVQHPGGTMPERFKNPADLDGLYRLLSAEGVTHASLLSAPCQRTLERMRGHEGVTLLVHDTTVLDYSGLKSITELGQIGEGHGRGYYAHQSLAVTAEEGRVLGLAGQLLHARRRVRRGETKAQRRACPKRESRLWKGAVEGLPADRRWVDVADRGADITEFLDYEDQAGRQYVVRSQHNRWMQAWEQGRARRVKLHDWVRQLAPLPGHRVIAIPAREKRPARTARLAAAHARLTLLPPRQARGEHRDVGLAVHAVRVWEVEPPEGAEPVEWILLTNVSVGSQAEAWERAQWYTRRWIIEELHKGMKTGCQIQRLQFTQAKRLQAAIALLTVVATFLLELRDLSRDAALRKEPAERHVPALWVRVLGAWRHGRAPANWNLGAFMTALARLGGHQNRRHDHPPGWIVLWRGWSQLQAMVAGARAIAPERCGET
jgi:hypothetical protein